MEFTEADARAFLHDHALNYAQPAGFEQADAYAAWYVDKYGHGADAIDHAPAHSGRYGWDLFLRERAA